MKTEEALTRGLVCFIVLFLFLVLSLFVARNIDNKPRTISFFPPLNIQPPCLSGLPPLKVYMYDLPRRFNVGMLNSSLPDNVHVTLENMPAWKENKGLLRQHSVEYWMMASLLYQGNGNETGLREEVIRVMDPEQADVYFVPFFSSISYNKLGLNMTDPNSLDKKLQHEMLDILQASSLWKRSGGRDHVIPLHHPNAFRHYRDKIKTSIFVVADFGRLMKISKLPKDVVAPYPHMVESLRYDDVEDPYESRKTLLFFRGGTVRKDEGKVRARLKKILQGAENVIFEESKASSEGFKASTEGMHSSKFCLHPAGDTPSSCRLFDAIVSHCIPVIVSNKIELPYENELDYKEFAIFFSVNEAIYKDYMLDQLRAIPKEKWMKMWLKLKSVAHHFEFQYPPKKDDAVSMIWRQVRQKLPEVKLGIHRSRRLKIPDWWM